MREKKLRTLLKKAIELSHLYNDEEFLYMKKELNNIEKLIQIEKKSNSKGFGN
jgi:hypothetical protein